LIVDIANVGHFYLLEKRHSCVPGQPIEQFVDPPACVLASAEVQP
jgi:hypothetical protein